MRSLRKPWLLVFFFGAISLAVCAAQTTPPAPSAQSPTKAASWGAAEKAVTKLEQDWFKIQLAHDWDKMRLLLGDDFQLIDSDGTLGDRDSMIAGYKQEAPSVVTIGMTLLVSHAVASDCVVATGLDDITLKAKDGNISHRYERFTDVWVLRNHQWLCVAEQLTLAHP
jgi:ketosteroid isomerase-like protein